MEGQGQGQALLTPETSHEIPPKQRKRVFGSTSANRRSSEHTYSPVQTSDSPEYLQHPTNPNPVPLPVTSRSPSPKPLVDRRGLFSGGWRSGCTYCAIVTAAVFLLNLSLTVWALLKYGYDHEENVGTLFEGGCSRTKTLDLVAHLFINALSAILLGASNYTMQCLSAPTRAEVDKAHTRKKWLDIGVPSVRNLGSISRVRLVLWFLLAISSVPLHFIYNSAIVSTTTSYDYISWAMAESNVPRNTSGFQKIDNRRCMEAYGKQFITDRQDVVVVVSGNGSTVPLSYSSSFPMTGNYLWICDSIANTSYDTCISDALHRTDSWTVNGTDAQYCLSKQMQERCRLQYSLYIMIAVIICNALKSICIFFAVFKNKNDPLVTVGDAIASFLGTPDKMTAGMCIVSKQEIKNGFWGDMTVETSQGLWKPCRPSWFRAASLDRWVMCYFLYLMGICTAAWLFATGSKSLGDPKMRDFRFWWSLGLGAIDIRFAVPILNKGGFNDLIPCVLLANLPQAIFSLLYLLYNSIFTCMLLGDEWDRFSHRKRPLRVTTPVGTQRSTHFLQLPYKYSLPLMVASGLLHWMISQSIFVIRIASTIRSSYELGAQPLDKAMLTFTALGWSPIAIVFMLILSSLMLLVAIFLGFRRYGSRIPLVGNCSAAISAACHPDPLEISVATVPVMWGVVKRNTGHCSFSSEEVTTPEPGQHYAGETSERIG